MVLGSDRKVSGAAGYPDREYTAILWVKLILIVKTPRTKKSGTPRFLEGLNGIIPSLWILSE